MDFKKSNILDRIPPEQREEHIKEIKDRWVKMGMLEDRNIEFPNIKPVNVPIIKLRKK